MATNDVYELASHATFFGQDIVSLMHFEANGGFTPSQAQAQTLADDWKEMLRQGQSQYLAYTTWTLRQVWGSGVTYHTSRPIRTGGRVYDGTHTGTLTGQNTSTSPLPSSVAAVIQWKTGQTGRRNRGRTYMAGLSADALTSSGLIIAGFITAMNALITTWSNKYFSGGTDANWDAGIFSFRYASGWRPALAHPHHLEYVGPVSSQNELTHISSWVVGNVFRSRRRREIGVGR